MQVIGSEMDRRGSILMERYELGRHLGQGAFAKVHYARCVRTGQSVAIKMIDKEKVLRRGLVEQIKREISIMRLIRHPNVLQLYEVMATKTKIYFVIEYAKGGELFDKVAKSKLNENVARMYFQQLINAVEFCHSRGVYHRDLKPENLLLDENENLKVSDFGLSALAESKRQDGLLHTTCGTPAYCSPEVINRKGYDGAKADIWSCGVILFVLLAGYLPFHDRNLMELYRKIGRAQYRCPRSLFPKEVQKLLSRILDPNPSTRISISKIKENPWFKKGLSQKSRKTDPGSSTNASSSLTESSSGSTPADGNDEVIKPTHLNAFDIISLSSGFDLSGLFEEPCQKKETRFTSRKPASVIISKLEEVAKLLKMRVRKQDKGLLKFEGLREGRKGVLSIDAEIFEVASSFYMVEMKKCNGDTLEYQKILREGVRPALQDIVWAWQGDPQQLPLEVTPPLPPPQQEQPQQQPLPLPEPEPPQEQLP